MTINEILAKIATYECDLVLITGGEPLLQKATYGLIDALIHNNFEVMVETNGSIPLNKAKMDAVHVCLDLKCPDSNMAQFNNYDNVNMLKHSDLVKFVVASENDFRWAIAKIEALHIYDFCRNICFSAVMPDWHAQRLAELMLHLKRNQKRGCRMQIQLHKAIWPHEERGR